MPFLLQLQFFLVSLKENGKIYSTIFPQGFVISSRKRMWQQSPDISTDEIFDRGDMVIV